MDIISAGDLDIGYPQEICSQNIYSLILIEHETDAKDLFADLKGPFLFSLQDQAQDYLLDHLKERIVKSYGEQFFKALKVLNVTALFDCLDLHDRTVRQILDSEPVFSDVDDLILLFQHICSHAGICFKYKIEEKPIGGNVVKLLTEYEPQW